MVSKTLQSLDDWLALAEEVLAEQSQHPVVDIDAEVPKYVESLQLMFDLGDI